MNHFALAERNILLSPMSLTGMDTTTEKNDLPDPNQLVQMASQMARDIINHKDHDRREYVGVIYRDASGQLAASELLGGGRGAAPLGKVLVSLPEDAKAMAVVHNHPKRFVEEQARPELLRDINKLPSENDWSTITKAFSGRRDLQYFILGPDDKLRVFDAVDRERWEQLLQDRLKDRHPRRVNAGPELPIPEHGNSPAREQPAPAAAVIAVPAVEPTLVTQARERLKASRQFDDLDGADHDRLAAALAVAAFMQGMQRIEHVLAGQQQGQTAQTQAEPGGGIMVFAVQGRISEPGHIRSQVALDDALKTPVETSMARLAAQEAAMLMQASTSPVMSPTRPDPPVRSGPSLG